MKITINETEYDLELYNIDDLMNKDVYHNQNRPVEAMLDAAAGEFRAKLWLELSNK